MLFTGKHIMRFSILHISDLHRDLSDEIPNNWLLDSIDRDFNQFNLQDPRIMQPSLCIVSGDLVHGVKPNFPDADIELTRQYNQVEELLVGLADRFFSGNRERIVILPGNHDFCSDDVIKSVQKIEIPVEAEKKAKLVAELFAPGSRLRWSWPDMCFYRITDEERYKNRFRPFATTYDNFYQGLRKYSLEPDIQFDTFDFPDLGFFVVALNSCFNNDQFCRAGSFHPNVLTEACRAFQKTGRSGWLAAAAWHHNISGGPIQDNYLDAEFLQLLMDAGVSLGFHGHQHIPECLDERYQLGNNSRKITIISASTLCADPRKLRPGVPRSYNVVEIDTDAWIGRVHQRQMINKQFNLPIWGPGHFISTNKSYLDFELNQPSLTRPAHLDTQLALEQADKLLGSRQWFEAAGILCSLKDIPLARQMLVKALEELGDTRRIIADLWPPTSIVEAVLLGGAILENGTQEEANSYILLAPVSNSDDASVREIVRRISERRPK